MLLVYVESGLAVIKQIHSIFFIPLILILFCLLDSGCILFLYSVQNKPALIMREESLIITVDPAEIQRLNEGSVLLTL